MKGLIVMTATAAALALAIPAYASAEVLCVDLTGGDCTQTSYAGADGFQQALTDANNNGSYPGPDTVRLGPEAYTAPLNTGFIYSGGAARVSIIGSGEGQTTIEMQTPPPPPDFTSFVRLLVGGVVGSSVSDLTVRMPAPADAANTIDVHNSGSPTITGISPANTVA